MIDHIFIKNYRAFQKENIPLGKNTLLIGTNASGKTTVLEALDLFFNNVFHYDYVRDKDQNVTIEIQIDGNRYRKVYQAPTFDIDYQKCIGKMYDINHIKYLYIKKEINFPKLLNDVLSINLFEKPTNELQTKVFKVFDYLDGVLGNSNYDIFHIHQNVQMNINEEISFTKKDCATVVSNVSNPFTIFGVDNFEENFDADVLNNVTEFSYQTILTTNDKRLMKEYDYHIYGLYRKSIREEFETIQNQALSTQKTYLLVEGKYDVAWFETALKLLGKQKEYRVIPCGGYGNIQFVKKQLDKEGLKTLVVTDGDTKMTSSLKRDVIELYADVEFVNQRFHTDFAVMPEDKKDLFKRIKEKDDIVKNVLSSWARKNLNLESDFVQELQKLL